MINDDGAGTMLARMSNLLVHSRYRWTTLCRDAANCARRC